MATIAQSDAPVAINRSNITDLDLIPVEVYARRIGWHPESLRRAIRQGRVHAVKIGREWRLTQAEALRIVTSGIPIVC